MARKLKRDLTVEEQLARGPMDLPFLMLVLLLTGIGLIMMFSASYAYALYTRTDHDATTITSKWGGGARKRWWRCSHWYPWRSAPWRS